MTYLATLYSKSLDRFETDCNDVIYWEGDLGFWIDRIPNHYNTAHNVKDFEIISIVKLGDE